MESFAEPHVMSERVRRVLESMRIRQFNQKPIKPVFLSQADLFSEVIERHKRFQTFHLAT